MVGARDALNKVKWAGGGLAGVLVWYVHRGAPGDARAVRGEDIVAVHGSFMELDAETMIPFHRVFRIERAGHVLWER